MFFLVLREIINNALETGFLMHHMHKSLIQIQMVNY